MSRDSKSKVFGNADTRSEYKILALRGQRDILTLVLATQVVVP